jgi:hypothetical protein
VSAFLYCNKPLPEIAGAAGEAVHKKLSAPGSLVTGNLKTGTNFIGERLNGELIVSGNPVDFW